MQQGGEERERFASLESGLVHDHQAHGAAARCLNAIACRSRQAGRPERVVADFPERGSKERPRPLLGHDEEHSCWERGWVHGVER